ncbi:hypothetical protein NVP1044O_01 [Vibrio phage 1.044.O._10N.261.51.B8]|uniref:Uncharacterized protein n=7 Tax=Autolykiviridae TaxID=2184034 RepID=A0A2I7QRC2_9VIRU|nr:hypothetical protein KMD64_gp01 [Vibrio phage 1.044.O._10N.261.51.B8]AUR83884.1 hypothetical protein NVP1043O_01 [Vibrio phage 1.043.O._10N.261.52.C7]AUR83905.1 hypothetical protein NVP1044O_01 [Vibrio phage 1.044.O._10N.261.51.B8]
MHSIPHSREQMNMATKTNDPTHVIRVSNYNKRVFVYLCRGEYKMPIHPHSYFELTTDTPDKYWIDANVIALEKVSLKIIELSND